MVKLATAREIRTYGPRPARNRWEYINAGLYLLAAVLLVGGFSAQLPHDQVDGKSGLALVLIALLLVAVVNVHDVAAHLSGFDCRFELFELDPQLALVEFAVPVVYVVGTALTFVAVLFFEIQMERGYKYRLEKHGLNLLIAGPAFWAVGSVHNVCQIYERADGHVQILQKCVQVPFLMGSLLFLVAGIVNRNDIYGSVDYSFEILGKRWVWLCLSGSILFFIGGLLNLVKVFKMQQMEGTRLEKLRGGAEERLGSEREGQVPLILEEGGRRKTGLEQSRRKNNREEARPEVRPVPAPVPAPSQAPAPLPTPYKDVLVHGSSHG